MSLTVGGALAASGLVPVDAQVLLAFVLGKDRAWLIAHRTDALARPLADDFMALAKRRREGEPVAYLTGRREFWGLQIEVTPDVLVPRPETETLVELALARLPRDASARVLDLGTGSGAIALAVAHERPAAHVTAADRSAAALAVARRNASRLALANVTCVESDWFGALGGTSFDLIASNPPYVAPGDPHLAEGDLRLEPRAALVPDGDGLAALAAIVGGALAHLRFGGWLLVEHGFDQADAVRALFERHGYVEGLAARDLAGHWRVAGGRKPPA